MLWVGVRCPVEVIWVRREETWGQGFEGADDDLRTAVERWQHEVHAHGPYDIEVSIRAFRLRKSKYTCYPSEELV